MDGNRKRENSLFRMRAGALTGALLVLSMAAAGSRSLAQNLSEQYLLAAANQDRAARGLPALGTNDQLTRAARQHAEEMARHRSISHQFSGEPELAARARQSGAHFSLVTENVAEASNSALIHELWMQSAGHRANLLDPAVNEVGIAVIQDRGQLYAVEDFAKTVERLSLEQEETTVANLLARAGLAVTPGAEAARATCSLSTGYAGQRQPWFVMRYTSSDLHRLPEQLTTRLSSGRYREAQVGACEPGKSGPFTSYSLAVMLFP